MPEITGRPSTRLEPSTTWAVVTDSPLKGLSFAREAGAILAWDEGNQLYLLNTRGESLSTSRVPNRILTGAISDEGTLIALLVEAEGLGLLILSADFDILSERPAPSEASFVTIDPHGRWLAVGSTAGARCSFINRHGRPAGRLETIQPLVASVLPAGRPLLIGAAAFGMLVGVEVMEGRAGRKGGSSRRILWQDRLMSNVGRLTVEGDGGMILASCFTHGNSAFRSQGAKRRVRTIWAGPFRTRSPTFPGRSIAAATLEGELVLMNSAGNVRWRTRLQQPVIALDIDPLGRYLIFGHATGEIIRLDLFAGNQGKARPEAPSGRAVARSRPHTAAVRAARAGSVRGGLDWLVQAVEDRPAGGDGRDRGG